MVEQNTNDWLKARLGKWNGSSVGELMVSAKKKVAEGEFPGFGKTAMTLIYKVAAERNLKDEVIEDDYMWDIYQNITNVGNKFTDYGHENEPIAVMVYEQVTGNKCEETTSTDHPTIPSFAASPDRLSNDGNLDIVIECKCFKPENFMKYKSEVCDNATLKAMDTNYYYQTQAEMMVTGRKACDFVVFCPFLKNDIHIVRINYDEEAAKEIEFRISEAEKIIDKLI